MAKDDTLYTRRTEQEIDEALAWLENLDPADAAADRKLPESKKNAFEVLPTWLKVDLNRTAGDDAPVDAPRIQSDNLSWLDSIASGLGGPLEEPPTMSWDETAIYHVSEEERDRALSDAVSAVEDKLEGESIESAMTGAALEAARQLDSAQADVEDASDIADAEPTSIAMPGESAFPLTEQELTAIYEQVERDFADEAHSFVPLDEAEPFDELLRAASDEHISDEELLAQSDLVPPELNSAELDAVASFDESSPSESLLDITIEDDKGTDFPSIAQPTPDAEQVTEIVDALEVEAERQKGLSPSKFPILADEIRTAREEVESEILVEDDLPIQYSPAQDEPTQIAPPEVSTGVAPTEIYMPDADATEMADEHEVDVAQLAQTEIHPRDNALVDEMREAANYAESQNMPTQIYLPDELDDGVAESSAIVEHALPSARFDDVDVPGMVAPTEIYLPDAPSELVPPDIEESVPALTEIYLPDSAESDFDITPAAEPSIAQQVEKTEIYIPESTDEPPNVLDEVDNITELYLPDRLKNEPIANVGVTPPDEPEKVTAELTEIYLPNEVPSIKPELTEVYLPDELEQMAELNASADIDSVPVPELTELFIPEMAFDESGQPEGEAIDGLASSEPTQLELPDTTDVAPEAAPVLQAELSEPTIISMVPISDRYKALADEVNEAVVDDSADSDVAAPTDTIVPRVKQGERAVTESAVDAIFDTGLTAPSIEVTDEQGSIADAIPEDPDEAMAWLEKMARRQQFEVPEKPTVEDITQTIGLEPDEVKAQLAELGVVDNLAEMNIDAELESAIATDLDIVDDTSEATQISDAVPFDQIDDPASLGIISAEVVPPVETPADIANPLLDENPIAPDASILDTQMAPAALNAPYEDNPEELSDALAWLEDVASKNDTPVDEMTVELDQEDVARLLEEHLSTKTGTVMPEMAADLTQAAPTEIGDASFEDGPTLITEMPDIAAALDASEPTQIERFDDSNELDEALAWLEAFADEDDTEQDRPGAMAAQALQNSVVDETVAPVFEPERLAAHKALDSADFSAVFRTYTGVLAKNDPLGANLVATDVGEWVKKHPDQPQLFQLLGEAHIQLGQFEPAAMAFKRALELR